ncbi:MAG: copper resistance protein CopC [Actinomycetota bacterium]|nr:copper resistance protein CopC [Actinomycetota bacterium]
MTTRDRRLIPATLVLMMGVLLMGTVLAPMAAAHSQAVSSDPDDGATVRSGPQRVTVTFNEPLQESFAVLTVVGPDGRYWQEGDPTVTGSELSVALRELGPAGTYTLNYRVTSADGHPVEGQRSFDLTVAGSGAPGPVADTAADSDDGGLPLWPFIVVAVVVLVGGLGVVLLLSRRSGRRSS